MSRWHTLPLVLLLTAWLLSVQSSKAWYLRDADHMCRATLADGTDYEVWERVLVTEWEGRPVYVKVQAYYRPRSGEFLSWNTGGLSEQGYDSDRKENPPKPGASCELPYHHILLYQQLGHDFFRPRRLEFDARPYTYDSLITAKKVDSNWKLEIKGADEPNSATVLLDGNFKLLEVTKNPATH